MAAGSIDVILDKIVCRETESFSPTDKTYVLGIYKLIPRDPNFGNPPPLEGANRLPDGTYWSMGNNTEISPNMPIFHIDDYEGKVQLQIWLMDQDMANSLSDDDIKRAADAVGAAAAGAAVAAGAGPLAPAVGAFARALTAMLGLLTDFDKDDLLGMTQMEIVTDVDKKTSHNMLCQLDGADYTLFYTIKVDVN